MAWIKLKRRIPASSILEVVIAMVVIVTVFTIAMMIYGNVQRLSLSSKKIKAQAMLHDVLLNVEKSPEISQHSFTIDNIRVDEAISSYTNSPGLLLVDLVAYDQNQEKIAELKEVINGDQ